MEVSGKRLDEDIVSKLCEPCQENHLSTQADGYCNDCEEHMCHTCFRSHLTMKLGRNHVLGAIPGDKGRGKQKQEVKCKKHTREAIKYYCRNHDRVVCGDCIVSDHMTCKPEFITDLGKKFEESSEFKNLLGQFKKWEVDIAESEPRIESYRKENHTLFDNAIREIKKFRKDINVWLDTMEKNIEAEVRKISEENEMHLSELEKKIRNVSDEIVKIKDELDTNVYPADSLFIRRVECKPKVDIVTKAVSEFKSVKSIKTYSFEPETKVKEMLTSSMKLGIIKVTSMIKTENKPTTEAGPTVKNVYQLPGTVLYISNVQTCLILRHLQVSEHSTSMQDLL
jgi:hypothetical protein